MKPESFWNGVLETRYILGWGSRYWKISGMRYENWKISEPDPETEKISEQQAFC